MSAIDGVDAVECPGGDHVARAERDFLGRLEDDANFAFELVAHVVEDVCGAEHHGHVAVVSARVHLAFVERGVVKARFLVDVERIHVRAQCDALCRHAVLVVRAFCRALDGGDDARADEALELVVHVVGALAIDESVVDSHLGENAADVGRRRHFVRPHFRMTVEVPSQFDDL